MIPALCKVKRQQGNHSSPKSPYQVIHLFGGMFPALRPDAERLIKGSDRSNHTCPQENRKRSAAPPNILLVDPSAPAREKHVVRRAAIVDASPGESIVVRILIKNVRNLL